MKARRRRGRAAPAIQAARTRSVRDLFVVLRDSYSRTGRAADLEVVLSPTVLAALFAPPEGAHGRITTWSTLADTQSMLENNQATAAVATST